MKYSSLPTPSLLIDLNRVEHNCRFMLNKAQRLGVRLRPHVKTHKCVELARLQVGGDSGPITVSTLAEARYFREHGFKDIVLAVPIAPCRVSEAMEIGVELLVDSPEAVRAIEACSIGRQVKVWLKVDCGYGRAGVVPGTPQALDLALMLNGSKSIMFRGLLTHGGHSYDCHGPDEILGVARQERDVVVSFAKQLEGRGVAVVEISVGSTPTMMHVDHLEGVTEIRPGNYALFDGYQAAIGSCNDSDVAVRVLTSVIGAHADRLILDVGALALSKDPGPTHVDPQCGYGRLFDVRGQPITDLKLVGLSQEHGKVSGAGSGRYRVGDKLLVEPNHSCLTMACFPESYVIRDEGVVGSVQPARGW